MMPLMSMVARSSSDHHGRGGDVRVHAHGRDDARDRSNIPRHHRAHDDGHGHGSCSDRSSMPHHHQMVVVVIVTTAACVIVIVMVRVRLFFFQMVQRFVNRIALFHCSQDLLAVQRVPICRDDRRVRIVFPQQGNDLREFLLVHALGMAENDGRRVFHLVIKELAESSSYRF